MNVNETDKIKAFWNWFSCHQKELGEDNVAPDIIAELEEQLFLIKRLDWEIGPGSRTSHQFALSPQGDLQLLEFTTKIIELAPRIEDWEFFAAKPPKSWNLIFELLVEGAPHSVDGKLWEFVAYKFKDGTYDLVFKPNSSNELSEEYLYWASTIIIDGEIGEERRMRKVGKVEIVATWDNKSAGNARRLELGLLEKIIK